MWNIRVNAYLIRLFSTSTNRETVALRSFCLSEFDARGVRKVTTGITGLWQPSVHSDVEVSLWLLGSWRLASRCECVWRADPVSSWVSGKVDARVET